MKLLDNYERVIYRKNPLVEVLAQIKFPTSLLIASTLPTQFQQELLDSYPIFEPQGALHVDIEGGNPNAVMTNQYLFKSGDDRWSVTLASDSLTLSTSDYVRWEEFSYRLREIINALLKCYKIGSFSRIGLRYRDIIDPEPLDLLGCAWAELITPVLLGIFDAPELGEIVVDHTASAATFAVEDFRVNLQTSFVLNQNENKAFLIDSDFFQVAVSTAGVENAIGVLSRLHTYSGPVFRFCITEKLHQALGPEPVRKRD
ncbi:TIGR04255 family protein [Rhizobium sp. SJZ105]|uniref:TIGR04255 family protein n=1 Tax=Rhizobium sp. SJZ105 TaxID=2572678 RepID=UPI001AED2E23|nr:TIGR04255 family protein [Rhizobium sp. SJZ105]